MFLLVALGHIICRTVHKTHGLENLWIERLLLFLIVRVFLLLDLCVTCLLVDLIVVLCNKMFLSNLAQVLQLQVLNEDHLRVEHQLLVIVHLGSEVVAGWREVEDQMEVLAHALKEAVVELVALC